GQRDLWLRRARDVYGLSEHLAPHDIDDLRGDIQHVPGHDRGCARAQPEVPLRPRSRRGPQASGSEFISALLELRPARATLEHSIPSHPGQRHRVRCPVSIYAEELSVPG